MLKGPSEAGVVHGTGVKLQGYIKEQLQIDLGCCTPIQFARKETETIREQGSGSGRPAASLRPNLDFLYNLKHIINSYQTNTLCGPVWVT